MSQRPYFVVNPRSAGGQTGRIWEAELLPRIQARLPNVRWAFTTSGGQAAALARRAWQEEGAELVVAVGGDGTVNEVVNGVMGVTLGGENTLPVSRGASWPRPEGEVPRPVLGVLPRGTGCDLVRSLAIPTGLEGALEVLLSGSVVQADVGQVRFAAHGGGEGERYFFNISGAGANGEVVDRVNRSGKKLGGFLNFLLATLATLARYYMPQVEISVDDGPLESVPLNVLFVCNAQYCGGGMRVGKDARLDDGVFKVVRVAGTSRAKSFYYSSRLYSGEVDSVPGTVSRLARKVVARSSQPVLVDCDGEQPGMLPASWEVVPGALRVMVGAGALSVGR